MSRCRADPGNAELHDKGFCMLLASATFVIDPQVVTGNLTGSHISSCENPCAAMGCPAQHAASVHDMISCLKSVLCKSHCVLVSKICHLCEIVH